MSNAESNPDNESRKSTPDMDQARSEIRKVYDSGTPFFTRKALQDLGQQMEEVESGQRTWVSCVGLDGHVIQERIMTGEVDPDSEPEGLKLVLY